MTSTSTSTPFFTLIEDASRVSLQGTTLLIPAVSIGSVPQLAVDLLLHHAPLELVKVGRIDPSFCFPFVGPSDSSDGSSDLTTALEVFSNGKLTVIQQRSPVYKSHETAYIAALTHWITVTGFTETLWLSSIDAAARTDDEFTTPLLSLLPPNTKPSTPIISTLAAKYPPFNPPKDPHTPSTEAKISVPHIPGSLLTRKLLHHISDAETKPSLGALLYFAAEGDTRHDAHLLAELSLNLVSSTTPKERLAEPPSWSALFGRPPAPALYA